MNYSQILLDAIPMVASIALSSFITMKVAQAVMNERIKNIKESLDDYKYQVDSRIDQLKIDYLERTKSDIESLAFRIENVNDLVKDKADKSEVTLVISNIARVEGKIDQLLLMRK